MIIRLDKYLADMNIGTRSQVKDMIRKGRVAIDSVCCKKADTKIDTALSTVTLDNVPLHYKEYEYFMLNKPQGVVSATEDNLHSTVLDLLDDVKIKDLFPVGRLDIDTEGLLLITNDGELCHRLLSPRKHVNKVYYAKIQGKIDEIDQGIFEKGIEIEPGIITKSAKLVIESKGEISYVYVTLQEGRFHQVKRMFEAIRKPVLYLKRVQMGPLVLDDSLALGEYRTLTKEEITALRKETKLDM